MRERFRYGINISKLELDESWPPFALSSLIALILIVYSLLLLTAFASVYTGFQLGSPSNLPGTGQFTKIMNRVTLNAMWTSTYIMSYLIVSIIPLVISITFASSFENGTLRNLLSLPITRNSVLFAKVLIVFSIIAIPSVFGLLLGTFWFLQNSISVTTHILLSVSLLLVVFFNIAISILVAIQTKSLMKGTFLSLAICYVLFLASNARLLPIQLLGIVNPIYATNIYMGVQSYLSGMSLGLPLLLLSMECCFIFALLLLVISVVRFNSVEVE